MRTEWHGGRELPLLAGLFGLGIIRGLSRPRHHHHRYDENREFYDADTSGDGCDRDCGD